MVNIRDFGVSLITLCGKHYERVPLSILCDITCLHAGDTYSIVLHAHCTDKKSTAAIESSMYLVGKGQYVPCMLFRVLQFNQNTAIGIMLPACATLIEEQIISYTAPIILLACSKLVTPPSCVRYSIMLRAHSIAVVLRRGMRFGK